MSEFLDVGGINQRLKAFDAEHGASIFRDGWIIFEDGAYRQANPLGSMNEPPTNSYELAKRKAFYHRIIFERAMKAFDDAKQDYRAMAQANLSTPMCGPAANVDQATADLSAKKNVALKAKAKYDKAQAAVEAGRPERERARERQNHRNQEMNREVLAAIDEIEL